MEISFGANLIIDKNFGKKTPKKIDAENLQNVAREYREFVETDRVVNALTEGDTIEISTKSARDGYYINMNFFEKGSEEPVEVPICIGKGVDSQFRTSSLKFFTYWFIAHKSGEKPRFSESIFKYTKRGVMEYAKMHAKKTDL